MKMSIFHSIFIWGEGKLFALLNESQTFDIIIIIIAWIVYAYTSEVVYMLKDVQTIAKCLDSQETHIA